MPCPDAAKLEQDVWVLMQRIGRYEADLAAAQSRAAGYALLVAEMSGHLVHVIDAGTNGGGWAEWECRVCLATRTWFGAADAKPQIKHKTDCILAADPEARAALLLKEREGND